MSQPTFPLSNAPDTSASVQERRGSFVHTVRGKLILGLTPGFLALLLLLGVSLKATDILVAANQHLAEAGQELAATRALQLSLGQIQLLLNESSTDSDAALYARFQRQAVFLDQQFKEASALYGEQGERAPFQRALQRWSQVQHDMDALLNPHAVPLTPEARARRTEEVNQGLREVQTQLQALSNAVLAEMDRTVAAGQQAHDQASSILIASTLIVLLLGVFFLFWFARYLTTPLTVLARSARRLGEGDLSVRIAVDRQDEIAELAHEFNLMAEQLQKRTRELETVSAERTAYAQELRQVLRRNVQVQEEERKRIASDIHDGVSQWLMGAMFELQAARVRLRNENADIIKHLDAAQQVLKNVKEEMRRVIYDLHPPLLESNGLVTALRGLVQEQEDHFHIPIQFQVEGNPYRLAPDRELALFRIAQEALTNVYKHAHANQIHLQLRYERDNVTLTIQDNGTGFDTSPAAWTHRKHLGLTSMRERAIAVGADIHITSQPGQGSKVQVIIPASLQEPLPNP